jgi:hypothetical protein
MDDVRYQKMRLCARQAAKIYGDRASAIEQNIALFEEACASGNRA